MYEREPNVCNSSFNFMGLIETFMRLPCLGVYLTFTVDIPKIFFELYNNFQDKLPYMALDF